MNLNSEKFDARNLPLVDLKLQNWSKLTRVQNCLFDQKKLYTMTIKLAYTTLSLPMMVDFF
jgi:hypothetical protein